MSEYFCVNIERFEKCLEIARILMCAVRIVMFCENIFALSVYWFAFLLECCSTKFGALYRSVRRSFVKFVSYKIFVAARDAPLHT